jgi:hypothetical protein
MISSASTGVAVSAIRDFIGLSENSCDFNASDGVPGFGSLITDDAGRLLSAGDGEAGELDAERLCQKRDGL